MKIRRFTAEDSRQAMRSVRAELGDDAVILSSRKVNGGVEIVAGANFDDATLQRELDQEPREFGVASAESLLAEADKLSRSTSSSSRHSDDGYQHPVLQEIRAELGTLREMLEGDLAQMVWSGQGRKNPLRIVLLRQLQNLGLSADVSAGIIEKIQGGQDRDRSWQDALKILADDLPVCHQDVAGSGGVIAVMGPTGVGKTTTVAKLAAQYALRHGRKQVALVTTDNYRIGGREQLETFGKILGVPVKLANSARELGEALREFSDRGLVMIDTAGMSQRDITLARQFDTLRDSSCDIKVLLTLSATSQSGILDEVIAGFGQVKLAGAVVTKCDETTSLGAVITALIKHRLPLAYVGTGQRVPEDIDRGDGIKLTREALRLAKAGSGSASAEPYQRQQISGEGIRANG